MDVYGVSAPTDVFPIDDLLDFSNDEIFSISNCSSTATTTAESHYNNHHHQPHSDNSSAASGNYYDGLNCSNDFTDYLSVPSDDVAELEWLSNFVEDSFTNFPANSITGTMNLSSNTTSSFHKSRSKRSRSTSNWTTSSIQNPNTTTGMMKNKERSGITRERSCAMEDVPRRCTHCASETTPQWRTGPLGPKTLCNACGVRYKSGRLVPEYRPAASPTFVLTQHSNSHRKVIELRRQKEMNQQHPLPEEGMYGRRFRDC